MSFVTPMFTLPMIFKIKSDLFQIVRGELSPFDPHLAVRCHRLVPLDRAW